MGRPSFSKQPSEDEAAKKHEIGKRLLYISFCSGRRRISGRKEKNKQDNGIS